jgi:hypothetical protein
MSSSCRSEGAQVRMRARSTLLKSSNAGRVELGKPVNKLDL